MDLATSSIKTRLPGSVKSLAIYRRCLTRTSSLPTLSIRSSKLDYVGDLCTYATLYICVGKSSPTLIENKYNAGKRCQTLANAFKLLETFVKVELRRI